MKKYFTIIACLACLFISEVRGNVYVITNLVSAITNATAISVDRNQAVRQTIYARIGNMSLPLGLATNYTIMWEWRGEYDNEQVYASAGRIRNGALGHVVVTAALHSVDLGTYIAEAWAVQGTNKTHRLAWNLVSVTSGVVDASVNVTVNNITTGGPSPNITSTGGTIAVTSDGGTNVNLEAVGGGSTIHIYTNGVIAGAITSINVNASLFAEVIGGHLELGFISSAFPGQIGSNRTSITHATITNTLQIPTGISNIAIWAWGGGGGGGGSLGSSIGGGGGFTRAVLTVTPLEYLDVIVGSGGDSYSTGVSFQVINGGWPSGGQGVVRQNYGQAGGGGGRVQLNRGTNILMVVGGGGGTGAGTSADGGGGGSLSGGNGNGGTAGTGGTQTEGGTISTSTVPLAITNTVGGHLYGGSGGCTTNLLTGGAGGAGDGWYGGGGGLAINAAASRAGGGGGSSWCEPSTFSFYEQYRSVAGIPVGQELPEYIAGAGVAGVPGGDALFVWGY